MSIARIEIDFGMLPGEKLSELLVLIGDLVLPVLDPHEDEEPCVRYVSVQAYQFDESEYEIGFTPEEEDELKLGVPDSFRENFENN